jgi:hypothetical protein
MEVRKHRFADAHCHRPAVTGKRRTGSRRKGRENPARPRLADSASPALPAPLAPQAPSRPASSCPYDHLKSRQLAKKLRRLKHDGSGHSVRGFGRWRTNYRKKNGREYGPPFHTTVDSTLYCVSPQLDEWFNTYMNRKREGLAPGLARWQAEQKASKEAQQREAAEPVRPTPETKG